MANPIQLKRSSVSGRQPNISDLLVGEIAINLADGIIYTKDTTGNIIIIGSSVTSNVTEGTNLYYTVDRANLAIDNRVTKAFVDNLGVDANTLDGYDSGDIVLQVDFTTANITEDTNLFFTEARAVASLTAGNGIVIDSNGLVSANVTEIVTKPTIDALGVDAGTLDGYNSTDFAFYEDLTTANVVELTNLYYSNDRVESFVETLGYANAEVLVSAYTAANAAVVIADISFSLALNAQTFSIATHTIAEDAYDQANTATTIAQDAYNAANLAGSSALAILAYDQANTAYTQANTALIIAQDAYDEANLKLDLVGGTVSGSLTVEGDFVVTGNTTFISARELKTPDNLIYLNEAISEAVVNAVGDGSNVTYTTANNHIFIAGEVARVTDVDPASFNISYTTILAVTSNTFTVANLTTDSYVSGGNAFVKANINPDLGFSGGYSDGSYAHTGLFRDATDNEWKFFKGYTPEPEGTIDTTHPSFRLANVQADTFVGNITNLNNLTTDDLDEGSTNLYFSNSLVDTWNSNASFKKLGTDASATGPQWLKIIDHTLSSFSTFAVKIEINAMWMGGSASIAPNYGELLLRGYWNSGYPVINFTYLPYDYESTNVFSGNFVVTYNTSGQFQIWAVLPNTSNIVRWFARLNNLNQPTSGLSYDVDHITLLENEAHQSTFTNLGSYFYSEYRDFFCEDINVGSTATIPILNISNSERLYDSIRLNFGNSNDTNFWYNGSTNYLNLELETTSNGFIITDNGTTRFTFDRSSGQFSATTLSATTLSATTVNATYVNPSNYLNLDDNIELYFGTSQSSDVTMRFEGSSFVTNFGSGTNGRWLIENGSLGSGTARFIFDSSNGNIVATGNVIAGNVVTNGVVNINGLSLKNTDNQLIVVDAGGNEVTLGGGGGGNVQVSASPPVDPSVGDIWIDDDGRYLTYFSDGDTFQWVEISSSSANVQSYIVVTTTEVGEGTNLYYTNARVASYVTSLLTTSNVTEATNLYYTEARANTAIDNRVTKEFVDALAVTSNVASNIAVTVNSTNASYRVPFLLTETTANGEYQVGVDAGIYYNPSSNYLTISGGYFIGSISGTTGLFSSYIHLTGDDDYLTWGAGQDSKMFYDGVNNTMELELEADAQSFIITDNGNTRFTFNKSNALFTASDVTATGNLKANSYITVGSDLGSFSGSVTIDITQGNYFYGTAANTTTWTFSGNTAIGDATGFILEITNGGAYTQTWPVSVEWASNTAPTLTEAGKDLLVFVTRDGGTTYLGLVSAQDLS